MNGKDLGNVHFSTSMATLLTDLSLYVSYFSILFSILFYPFVPISYRLAVVVGWSSLVFQGFSCPSCSVTALFPLYVQAGRGWPNSPTPPPGFLTCSSTHVVFNSGSPSHFCVATCQALSAPYLLAQFAWRHLHRPFLFWSALWVQCAVWLMP